MSPSCSVGKKESIGWRLETRVLPHCKLLFAVQFCTPQLDCPVKGGGEEKVREISLSADCSVAADTSHRSRVPIKLHCQSRLTPMTLTLHTHTHQ